MNALTKRKSTVTAFCCLLLAIIAVVWAASASRTRENKDSELGTPVGNSFAQFSSDSVEVVSESGELIYSAPFDFPDRFLTRSGEVAAAWSVGGNTIVFLGEGGWKQAETAGAVLGVFGSDAGAVCAICETASGDMLADVYGAAGLAFSLTADGFFPLAAAISPSGSRLALLCVDNLGYALRTYAVPSGTLLGCEYLERAAYAVGWDDGGPNILYFD